MMKERVKGGEEGRKSERNGKRQERCDKETEKRKRGRKRVRNRRCLCYLIQQIRLEFGLLDMADRILQYKSQTRHALKHSRKLSSRECQLSWGGLGSRHSRRLRPAESLSTTTTTTALMGVHRPPLTCLSAGTLPR